ncbi:MAG: molybdopterin converting factor subunit 1 [Alphaproteobacteria bacterium]
MRVYYFAWLRHQIGVPYQDINLPDGVRTPNELMNYLCRLSSSHAKAFEAREHINIAIDKHYAGPRDPLQDAKEVAFFPPVTGG